MLGYVATLPTGQHGRHGRLGAETTQLAGTVARLTALMRSRFRPFLVLLATLTFAATDPAAAAGLQGTAVPKSFVGVNGGSLPLGNSVELARQLDLMVADGVQTVRVAFSWAQAQPYEHSTDVPPAQRTSFVNEKGVPTDFSLTDEIVAAAAARGLTVLPTVLYAPQWAAGVNHSGGMPPPRNPNDYAGYLTALVERYGPHGIFWQNHHPRLPITEWQIWNEANLPAYWPQPFAPSYVNLLRAAHAAIKRADPGAKVVLGALTNRAWTYLGQIYKIHGARALFDVIAVNGFTTTPDRVILYLRLVRQEINRLGDRNKPLLATEVSWPSAAGHRVSQHHWDTTERGQARNIATLLPLLAEQRAALGLAGFDYYAWVTHDNNPPGDDFSFAGLLHYLTSGQIVAKPALAAFRRGALMIEHCRKKGSQATHCMQSG